MEGRGGLSVEVGSMCAWAVDKLACPQPHEALIKWKSGAYSLINHIRASTIFTH
jgi:hypothetical protein